MEGELVYKTGLKREILDALKRCNTSTNTSAKAKRLQHERLASMTPRELKRRLEKHKAEYSGFLGDIIAQNPYDQPIESLLPKAISQAFEQISHWLERKPLGHQE